MVMRLIDDKVTMSTITNVPDGQAVFSDNHEHWERRSYQEPIWNPTQLVLPATVLRFQSTQKVSPFLSPLPDHRWPHAQ